MKYYRLLDDINYPQRWYLSEIPEVEDNWQFTEGYKINELLLPKQLSVIISQDGNAMDYTITNTNVVPIVSERIKLQLGGVSGLQFIPVEIQGKNIGLSYFIMVATIKKDCINDDLSEVDRFIENDPVRPDKAGHYSYIGKMIIDPSKTDDEDVFRIDKGENYLIVSERVKNAMEDIRASGLKFKEAY